MHSLTHSDIKIYRLELQKTSLFNWDTYRKFNMKVHSGRCCIASGDDTSLSNWCIFQLRFTTKISAFILTAHLSNAFREHVAYKKIVETIKCWRKKTYNKVVFAIYIQSYSRTNRAMFTYMCK